MDESKQKNSLHELNNHLAILDVFLSILNTERFGKDQLTLYQDAKLSLRQIIGMVQRGEIQENPIKTL